MSIWQCTAYSLPMFPIALLLSPVWLMLPAFYAKYYGLALTTIATISLVARLFDAVTDPLIGYFSDRYGSRKHWIIAGCLCLLVSSYFLFIPPEQVSATYYLCWFLAFYLAYTLFEIPHIAWGSELATRSHEKTKIYGARYFFSVLGGLLFLSLPMLPFFESKEFTPMTLKWSVLIVGILILPSLYLCIKYVPDDQTVKTQKRETLRSLFDSISQNRPLIIFLCAQLLVGMGLGMWQGLSFIYTDAYLDLGEKIPILYLLGYLANIASIPVWYRLSYWLGKKWAWGIGTILISIGVLCTAMIKPGASAFVFIAAVMIVEFIGAAALGVIATSLLSDIVDYGVWKFGSNHAALYFSAYTFISKVNVGIGGALGLGAAGWFGFDPAAKIHSEESVLGLQLAIAYVPALITLFSIIFIALIPLNARRHELIRRRIKAREDNGFSETAVNPRVVV